jgi:hypothetical protein
VYISDPVARLRFIRQAMDGLKESKQAVGAATLARVNNLAPPTVLAQASRLNFSTRLFNLLVTNIPGPQFPLYVLGRKLDDLFPVAFLPENHGLAVAIMSYNGGIDYGLLGDYDALPDIDVIGDGISESLGELLKAARSKGQRPPRRSGSAAREVAPVAVDGTSETHDGTPEPRDRATATNDLPEAHEGTPVPIIPSAGGRPKRGPATDMRAKRARPRGDARKQPPRS